MKKLFLVFAIAASMVACNNEADSTADAKDSIDSAASETKDMIDSTAEQKMDNVDSLAEQKKDSLDKIDSAANK